ncbi:MULTISPECIES: AzlC family ABC transporter permease [Alicyclobacillus]|uniref:AzlC family ABC transporter permease n=1 Tax=Alicyclobacillus acidoterrestris (strain ATCC 49025 / DSM 3922 / CIP 106132 / NCIMB 13137 / GD3B) TaxID=1356854 RepID=T0CXR2_ALIAG|nr:MULTISPECIES: AzlC family ABC transporter permease [Alicyclobacillus]EPZ44157.1 hypothetical protein N007_11580 [Alicyclobacillus acidoterrestris ATCC 49025]UNO49674.1 AzlC family ABC transporter permease [Alicyclobacillus acidoterrestris]
MTRTWIAKGLRDALPIVFAYFPVAVTFGVIATSNGVPWLIVFLISAWVYAGGAQFMLLSLALSGTSPLSAIVTTLLVNLRHFLYGTSLGPAFTRWSESQRWMMAFGLTDEVYAVTSSRVQQTLPVVGYQIPLVYSCYGSWLAGTAVGATIGKSVPAAVSDALGFALPALFLALLMAGKRSLPYFVAAIFGALLACLADMAQLGNVGMVLGAVVGATAGMFLEKRRIYRQGVRH